MSRSIKKGPFVQPKLLARVQAMNEAGEKRVLKTWSRASQYSLTSSVTPLLCMTDASMYRYMLPRIWSVTSWANLPLPAPSAVMTAPRNLKIGPKGGKTHGS